MNNHITHLEDMVITQGSLGGMKIQNLLWSIQHGTAQISTKWDGSPSVFAGWDEDGFFISTKSFLNITSSVRYRTWNEIDTSNLDDGLKKKLVYCLSYLRGVVPQGLILQGDLLWVPGDITWDGDYAMFHPNTLVYGIPDEIFNPKWELGIVWHSWIGKNGDYSQPRFGNLLTTENVLSIDPIVLKYDIDDDIITGPRDAFKKIDMIYLDKIAKTNPKFSQLIIQGINAAIRNDTLDNLNAQTMYDWIFAKIIESASKLKTIKGIDDRIGGFQELLSLLSKESEFQAILDFQNEIRVSKRSIINSLESHSKVKTWVKTNDGLVSSAHEGYVVIGQSESLKIVDRQQFSYMNFSPSILKGWDAPTRT